MSQNAVRNLNVHGINSLKDDITKKTIHIELKIHGHYNKLPTIFFLD